MRRVTMSRGEGGCIINILFSNKRRHHFQNTLLCIVMPLFLFLVQYLFDNEKERKLIDWQLTIIISSQYDADCGKLGTSLSSSPVSPGKTLVTVTCGGDPITFPPCFPFCSGPQGAAGGGVGGSSQISSYSSVGGGCSTRSLTSCISASVISLIHGSATGCGSPSPATS